MILYADTSALFKILVNEKGTDEAAAALDASELVASAEIAYVELRAALAAALPSRARPSA